MDSNSNSGTFSIRSETKEKFHALIKTALKENKSATKEKLVKNVQRPNDIISVDPEEEESKKVILERFLCSSSSGKVDGNVGSVTFIKPPIPKPRKKKSERVRKDSSSSKATFEVVSPKVIKKVQTGEIKSQSSSNGPYNCIKNVNEYNSELDQATCKVNIDSAIEIVEKGETEDLSDKTYSKSSRTITQNSTSDKDQHKEIELVNISKNAIEIVNERDKPKPVKKNLNNELKVKSRKVKRDYIDLKTEEECDSGRIVEIIIHKTDSIHLNAFIIHPVVKIHLVDVNTGEYFKKQDEHRPVVFYYENDDNDYILPVMTNCYNLQENRTFYPMWEETILFNESSNYLINENLIIYFEILDFLPMHVDTNSIQKSSKNGWINIAFAFLKPIGKNNVLNTNKKLRLQLYYPGKISEKDSKKCHVWTWWQKKNYKKYPSILYVTIKDVISPKKIVHTFRSKTPMQKEEISNIGPKKENISNEAEEISFQKWSRHQNKSFQLPTQCVAELSTFGDGCFVLKFSNNGSYLAAAIKIDDIFVIALYLVEHFEEVTKFSGHQKLIYSVNWSKDDTLLITASADNTLVIWDVTKRVFLQILPHPSYIYASDITYDNCVATGGYDKVVRIWISQNDIVKYDLCQELEKHKGYITSLCFNKHSTCLYSADSLGCIVEWKREENNFVFNRNIEISDIRGCIINEIILFPNEKKMLVHCRNSSLKVISVPNSCILQWLHGAQNTRVQTFCSISPCGHYVTSGNENGMVIIWDGKSGKHVKIYNLYPKLHVPVHCVRFSAKGNFVAMSHYGHDAPILIYGCEENEDYQQSAQENMGDNVKTSKFDMLRTNNSSVGGKKFQLREILQKMDNILK